MSARACWPAPCSLHSQCSSHSPSAPVSPSRRKYKSLFVKFIIRKLGYIYISIFRNDVKTKKICTCKSVNNMTPSKGHIRDASISVQHLHYLDILYLRRRMKIRIWQKMKPHRRVQSLKQLKNFDKSNKISIKIKHLEEQKNRKKLTLTIRNSDKILKSTCNSSSWLSNISSSSSSWPMFVTKLEKTKKTTLFFLWNTALKGKYHDMFIQHRILSH